MSKLYFEVTYKKNKSIRADDIVCAGRQIAYRKAKEIYGKSAVIFDFIEIYNDGMVAEFKCKMGHFPNSSLKITGHLHRFGVKLK